MPSNPATAPQPQWEEMTEVLVPRPSALLLHPAARKLEERLEIGREKEARGIKLNSLSPA